VEFSSMTVKMPGGTSPRIAGEPPEKAKTPVNGKMITGSAGRIERTGPTGSASVEWNTTTKRVMPSVNSS
jgi:hypothetical protein